MPTHRINKYGNKVLRCNVRFCDTSCSAKWRMTQPAFVGPRSAKTKAKISLAAKKNYAANPQRAQASSERMTNNNPMYMPGVREKVSQTLRAMGHTFSERGGNGRGPSPCEALLLERLPKDVYNHKVLTKMPRDSGYPPCYKIDLAFPKLKVGLEVDGTSHQSEEGRIRDAKKTELLNSLGWTVLRVRNERVEKDPDRIAKSLISKLKVIRRTQLKAL